MRMSLALIDLLDITC